MNALLLIFAVLLPQCILRAASRKLQLFCGWCTRAPRWIPPLRWPLRHDWCRRLQCARQGLCSEAHNLTLSKTLVYNSWAMAQHELIVRAQSLHSACLAFVGPARTYI